LYKETGQRYKGIIYGSFMKLYNGNIKVIEFNARFGDPECINVLHSLRNDLLDIFLRICDGTLNKIDIKFNTKPSVFKYIVPNGYPTNPVKNKYIYIDDDLNSNIIFSSISKKSEKFYTLLGSRALGYIRNGDTLEQACMRVEKFFKTINGPVYHRTDIGHSDIYNLAGVNIEKGNKVIKSIQSYVESTYNENVVSEFGDFSGMMTIPSKYKNPILITSTDGVGTKSILTLEVFGYEEGYYMLGQDLVNHCINDILVKGGEPLFFMDYYASNTIQSNHVKYLIKGMSYSCKQVGCTLLGGETAEMPDVYRDNHCDIVGTIIGCTNKDNIINGKANIKEGNVVIGLPSSGPHTNGYSLIRKLLKEHTVDIKFRKQLCTIHKSYYNDIKSITNAGIKINGMVHITGGGFIENPPRVLPPNLEIKYYDFEFSPLFKTIQRLGHIKRNDMLRIFNCGIGMILIISNDDLNQMNQINVDYTVIGQVNKKLPVNPYYIYL
jgi:phosphoribosylaminoimidazole synthetase